MRRRLLLPLLLLLLFSSSSCRDPGPDARPPRAPDPPVSRDIVARFQFMDTTLDDARDPEADRRISAHATALWQDPEGRIPWRPEQSGYSVSVEHVRALDASGKAPVYRIGVSVEWTRSVPGDVPEQHRITRVQEFAPGDGGADASALTEASFAALDAALAISFIHLEGATAPDSQIIAWIASEEDDRIEAGLIQARERRLVGAAPKIARLLVDRGLHVREALGAAHAIRDPALIDGLVRLTASQSPDVVREAIHALAAVGSPRARRYLESIAEGHAWAEARDVARELVR